MHCIYNILNTQSLKIVEYIVLYTINRIITMSHYSRIIMQVNYANAETHKKYRGVSLMRASMSPHMNVEVPRSKTLCH